MTDINLFYDESFDILALNERLLTMAIGHPQGSRSLQNGRVVILRDGVRRLFSLSLFHFERAPKHFKSNTAAILLKPAPLQTLESGRFEDVKAYFVLALVDHEIKHGGHGDSI